MIYKPTKVEPFYEGENIAGFTFFFEEDGVKAEVNAGIAENIGSTKEETMTNIENYVQGVATMLYQPKAPEPTPEETTTQEITLEDLQSQFGIIENQ